MRRAVVISFALAFCWTLGWGADWHFSTNKVRYRGGTVKAKTSAYDWNTTLRITDDAIELLINPNVKVRIPVRDVTSLSYGQEAYRRVSEAAGATSAPPPPSLFGLLHASKEHMIGIVYHTDDGKTAAVLLEAQFRSVLTLLKYATGKPVEITP